MHYIDEGPRSAPAVVFLHGNPTWSYLFRKLIGPLVSEGHRVLSVDHLGFGRSAAPDGAEHYTIERHSHRLATLLDSRALHDVTLVAHDWGAPIGLPWAAQRPEAIRGLFVLNTFAPQLPGPMGQRGMVRSRVFGPMLVKGRNLPTEQFLFRQAQRTPKRSMRPSSRPTAPLTPTGGRARRGLSSPAKSR